MHAMRGDVIRVCLGDLPGYSCSYIKSLRVTTALVQTTHSYTQMDLLPTKI